MDKFPVLKSGDSIYVCRESLNDEWAIKIHGQTLDRLAERGGLSPKEIVLNVEMLESSQIRCITDDYASGIVNKIRLN